MERVIKAEIFPSNRPNVGSIYSAKDGNPQINFQIGGNQPMWLDSATLTLNFTLRILQAGAGNLPPNNDDQSGGGGVEIRTNAFINAMACFSSINLTNAVNDELEFVRSLPRLAATIIPYKSEFDDYANDLQFQFGATSNTEATGMMNNVPIQVSAPLLCGMTLNQDLIPLDSLGGLNVILNLAPSIEALFGANAAGAYYEIDNPTLRCSFITPQGGVMPKIANYPYLAYSSYYNTIQTNDETQNINCNLSSVLSTFTNFIPTNHIANTAVDSNSTYELMDGDPAGTGLASQVPITRYSLLRNSQKYPYRFQVDEVNNVLTNPLAPGGYQTVYEAQLQRNAYTGVTTALSDLTTTLVGNISQGTQAMTIHPNVIDQHYNSEALKCYAVGGRYDALGIGEGANFVGRPFSQRIESRFVPISGIPCSSYTFMLSKHMISMDGRGDASLAN